MLVQDYDMTVDCGVMEHITLYSNLTLEGVSAICAARYTVLSGYDPTHLTIFGDFHS